jgi:probable addiction module antidote protein
MNKRFVNYDERLLEDLQDPREALAYLNAAMLDDDERVFLLALKDVIEAQGGNLSEIAKEANIDRVSLHRILSKKGNPKWSSIRAVFKALNLKLTIQ